LESEDIRQLYGLHIGLGCENTNDNNSEINNKNNNSNLLQCLKCDNCHAQIIVNEKDGNAKCHWCQTKLIVDDAHKTCLDLAPDLLLPFSVSKDEAQSSIKKFIGKRRFFANSKFIKNFTAENINGVYFPHYLVNTNCTVHLAGLGEQTVKSKGNGKKSYSEVNVFNVSRDFLMASKDLIICTVKGELDDAFRT